MNKTNNSIIQPDHVHIMFEAKPSIIFTQVICTLKSYSAKILLKKFKTTLSAKYWKPHIWSPSYCLCTVSERSATVVKNYLNTQDFLPLDPHLRSLEGSLMKGYGGKFKSKQLQAIRLYANIIG